jgi:monofunctional biosynthetic peptidoglycan transglycosylase
MDGATPGSGLGTSAAEESTVMTATRVLVDFSDAGEVARWGAVNDGVMGGLSDSRLAPASDSTAVFEGNLSLENNGGFASVRREPFGYGLSGAHALVLDVRGDGRRYQFRIRTDDRFDGVAYRAFFDTEQGKWNRITLPFDEFRATFRGRSVPGAPVLDPGQIRQIGFLIADKRPGAFRLEIKTIGSVTRSADG